MADKPSLRTLAEILSYPGALFEGKCLTEPVLLLAEKLHEAGSQDKDCLIVPFLPQ